MSLLQKEKNLTKRNKRKEFDKEKEKKKKALKKIANICANKLYSRV